MVRDKALTGEYEGGIARRPALDADQLAEIYQAYSARVFRYMCYRLPNAADAQDLTSAVFERVIDKYASFDPDKGAFEVWLFSIARNLLRDHFRKAKRRQWFGLDAAERLASRQKSPEQLVLDGERFSALEAALSRLKERELSVVSLKYAAGLRNVDIARVMRLSEKNVGVILCRAMKRLRMELEEGEDE